MILSDRNIKEHLANGSLEIDPLDDPEKQIQPASVDLRLAGDFLRVRRVHTGVIDLLDPVVECDHVVAERSLVLEPGEFVLGATFERVSLPDFLAADVGGKSSLGRLGLVVHVTAGFIDPGYDGNITLEIVNLNPNPLRLHVGMYICQLKLKQLSSPAERPYGAARGSHYVGKAAKGAQASVLIDGNR